MNTSVSFTTQDWNSLNQAQQQLLLQRPGSDDSSLNESVASIIASVRQGGDQRLLDLTNQFDGVQLESLEVPRQAWEAAESALPNTLMTAIHNAADRIRHFHTQALPQPFTVETAPGVVCQTQYRPIKRVGLYIPAGSAPLPSTMLMLGIPATLAGCQELIVCSPAQSTGRV